MSYTRTAERSTALKQQGFKLRRAHLIDAWPAAPAFIAAGTGVTSTAGVTVTWPTRHQSGDLGLMVIEASGGDATVTPSGWTHVSGSPVVDVADATGSKLSVLWKFAESDQESGVSVADPGDHIAARIYNFRGVRRGLAPGRASATDTKVTASANLTWPSISTLAHNSMVVCVASRPDDSSSTSTFSVFANATLSGVAAAGQYGTVSGDGGGFAVFYGSLAAPGASGSATANLASSMTNAMLVLGLEPSIALPA